MGPGVHCPRTHRGEAPQPAPTCVFGASLYTAVKSAHPSRPAEAVPTLTGSCCEPRALPPCRPPQPLRLCSWTRTRARRTSHDAVQTLLTPRAYLPAPPLTVSRQFVGRAARSAPLPVPVRPTARCRPRASRSLPRGHGRRRRDMANGVPPVSGHQDLDVVDGIGSASIISRSARTRHRVLESEAHAEIVLCQQRCSVLLPRTLIRGSARVPVHPTSRPPASASVPSGLLTTRLRRPAAFVGSAGSTVPRRVPSALSWLGRLADGVS